MSRAKPAEASRACTGNAELPPRERILAAARELFYARGIRAVSVDEIAAAAATNKMTLYRHFESKDRLIAEYLRELAAEADSFWADAARAHPAEPRAQLEAWLQQLSSAMADPANRGCALANAAIEIPEKNHPARQIIEQHKTAQREQIAKLCREAGFRDYGKVADEIFLLLEGARVNMQSVGRAGPCHRMEELFRALLDTNTRSDEAR
jgi:AcrR family transcriptional regulator